MLSGTDLLNAVKNQLTQAFSNRPVYFEFCPEELTREVREHNHFARRIPVVEEQIKEINHRIEDLEREG